jgi:rsbT co-antagonist protein RsbR
VADALLRVAQAAKLLGTQIVLTGIRAEVAQTIVHLGADMSGIVTRSNLQDGLRYALTIADANLVPATAFSRKS